MNLSKYRKWRAEESELKADKEKKAISSEYCDLQYECKNSGILLIPTQINDFEQLNNSPDIIGHLESPHNPTENCNVTESKHEVCIFDDLLSNNLFEEGILHNSTPTPIM